MLMFGVIFLGNAQTPLQLAFAGAFIIMNALYWIVAALPNRVHWDTSCFNVVDQCIERLPVGKDELVDEKGAQRILPKPIGDKHKTFVDENETFTEALWKAIVVTKDVEWIKRSAAAPDTPAWIEWLEKAEAKANESGSQMKNINGVNEKVLVWELPDWNPVKALNECLMAHSTTGKKRPVSSAISQLKGESSRPGSETNV